MSFKCHSYKAQFCYRSPKEFNPAHYLFSPHVIFLNLMHNINFDKTVLLDWLTSNETQFLHYFIKYAKFSINTKDKLLQICESSSNTAMVSLFVMLTSLKNSIEMCVESKLFPFPAKPLLRNITNFQLFLKIEIIKKQPELITVIST